MPLSPCFYYPLCLRDTSHFFPFSFLVPPPFSLLPSCNHPLPRFLPSFPSLLVSLPPPFFPPSSLIFLLVNHPISSSFPPLVVLFHINHPSLCRHTDYSLSDPISVLGLLCEAAEEQGHDVKKLVNHQDNFGQTPLHRASLRGSSICGLALLQVSVLSGSFTTSSRKNKCIQLLFDV